MKLSTILDRIVAHKISEVKALKEATPLRVLKEAVKKAGKGVSFLDALGRNDRVNIIAEVKKGSPSKGIICHDFDPVGIAKEYAKCGAAAVSVLTDEKFFFGSLDYLRDIKKAIPLPVLRKDFIIDEYQIYEARAAGADAVLLIAAILEPEAIDRLLDRTHELGMDALMEVHDNEELYMVLETDAKIIGINNRNLGNFKVDLGTTEKLISEIPFGKIIVSESGIHTKADIDSLIECGANAFLVGEALMDGKMPVKDKMREFMA